MLIRLGSKQAAMHMHVRTKRPKLRVFHQRDAIGIAVFRFNWDPDYSSMH